MFDNIFVLSDSRGIVENEKKKRNCYRVWRDVMTASCLPQPSSIKADGLCERKKTLCECAYMRLVNCALKVAQLELDLE